MRTVEVPLGSRTYKIQVDRDLLARLGQKCRQLGLARQCAVITDEHVAKRYAPVALRALQDADFSPFLVTIPAGEPSKSLRFVQSCYHELAQHRLERKSFVVALGGGVVGDLAGFVA